MGPVESNSDPLGKGAGPDFQRVGVYFTFGVPSAGDKHHLSEGQMDGTNKASSADAGSGLPFWFDA